MKAIQVSDLPIVAVIAVATVTFSCLLSMTEAHPVVNEPVATSLNPGEFIVTIRPNNNTILDGGSCDLRRPPNQGVVFTPISVKPQYHFATARLESLLGGPEAVCNQCIMIRNADQTRSVMSILVADCPTCGPRQIELTPAAHNTLEGLTLGFMSFVPC
ncbi:MAG: hypothetical protein J3R72DRAFT_487784 [Linnemannia gamsii]|nr:MAG: hypothetical protein J3R72DRAFT_487784 [Linnemannia gamsii]